MRIITAILFLTTFQSFGQIVGGEVVAEKRDIITETDYTIEGYHAGWAIYTLSINREGVVTEASLKESNLPSRLDNMDVRNYVMKLKFQPGTYYPKFHHADVKITMTKAENPKQLEIEID